VTWAPAAAKSTMSRTAGGTNSQGNDTPVAPAVSRVFAFLIQAEQSIAVDQKSPGGSDSHGERSLWKAVKRVEAKETEADIILSNAHKSKGSEWDSVRLAQDFDRHIMSCQLSRRWH
jgi:hypothetical protein